jgi:hypothetical protein
MNEIRLNTGYPKDVREHITTLNDLKPDEPFTVYWCENCPNGFRLCQAFPRVNVDNLEDFRSSLSENELSVLRTYETTGQLRLVRASEVQLRATTVSYPPGKDSFSFGSQKQVVTEKLRKGYALLVADPNA